LNYYSKILYIVKKFILFLVFLSFYSCTEDIQANNASMDNELIEFWLTDPKEDIKFLKQTTNIDTGPCSKSKL